MHANRRVKQSLVCNASYDDPPATHLDRFSCHASESGAIYEKVFRECHLPQPMRSVAVMTSVAYPDSFG